MTAYGTGKGAVWQSIEEPKLLVINNESISIIIETL